MSFFMLPAITDFDRLTTKVLVSSSVQIDGHPGGLFLIDFEQRKLEQLYTGDCRGFVQLPGQILIASHQRGMLRMNRNYHIEQTHNSAAGRDAHGMAILSSDIVLVAETKHNSIGCYKIRTLERIGEIRFHLSNNDELHLNDLWIDRSSLYVSMFTPHGKWREIPNKEAGCIVKLNGPEINPYTTTLIEPNRHIIKDQLSQPHSILMYNGQMAYCDSMLHRVITDRSTLQLKTFTRGLAVQDGVWFVGQSGRKSRPEALKHVPDTQVSGIHLYDSRDGKYGFLPIPARQIYQLSIFKSFN
ncbi:hypothetical protein A8990_12531 [Paenibacillus taihuensis]|uniref:Sugar lactone lactonase YvrE n=1 Tax=Paenibacillus taihuensis TaxID=1156355 RepID=A0A3D9RRN9_9BACL|nr:hypothetical protein [Paenibacillus taihuensis]REE78634.1 hypothetical protein A8990_12531 [Paenibacillus taihuensis]